MKIVNIVIKFLIVVIYINVIIVINVNIVKIVFHVLILLNVFIVIIVVFQTTVLCVKIYKKQNIIYVIFLLDKINMKK